MFCYEFMNLGVYVFSFLYFLVRMRHMMAHVPTYAE